MKAAADIQEEAVDTLAAQDSTDLDNMGHTVWAEAAEDCARDDLLDGILDLVPSQGDRKVQAGSDEWAM